MVSSTYEDLRRHRELLIKALHDQGLVDLAMEHDAALAGVDVIDASLQKVRDASAYVAIIGSRYGQVPTSKERNRHEVSLTELEFDEAQRLQRPTLLFLMADDHPVRVADVEVDPWKRAKLEAFRARAKVMRGSQVPRVYAEFSNIEDFEKKAIRSIISLRELVDAGDPANPEGGRDASNASSADTPDPLPLPPALYAEPPYSGSHEFVGYSEQLSEISHWSQVEDPRSVLLIYAMGGTGKSMLTWQWLTAQPCGQRTDWAGRFWYSFYEQGAVMSDFCRRALAYMTSKPLHAYYGLPQRELARLLRHQLQARPWLLVLDGLERVLVHYHRIDASSTAEGEAFAPSDTIALRNPRAAIRPTDDELLRTLTVMAPSKVLITSRLRPRSLENSAGGVLPGVKSMELPGLLPEDGERLIRSCAVRGDSAAIQRYLTESCGCHPLVIGALAGLINGYSPGPGDFDVWIKDDAGGGRLDIADLDLRARQNHILQVAVDDLDEAERRLLAILALMDGAVDYKTVEALDPRTGPELSGQVAPKPSKNVARRQLMGSLQALSDRGLLQARAGIYDLHPVVRSVVVRWLAPSERTSLGDILVDHFTSASHLEFGHARSIAELEIPLGVIRTELALERYESAYGRYWGDLAHELFFHFEAYPEILALLKPFFPDGWAARSPFLGASESANLASDAGRCLRALGEPGAAESPLGAVLDYSVERETWPNVVADLRNLAAVCLDLNDLTQHEHLLRLALAVAEAMCGPETVFVARLDLFRQRSLIGDWAGADALWSKLGGTRPSRRNRYRPGDAEVAHAQMNFWRGTLDRAELDRAEAVAISTSNGVGLRRVLTLRGESCLARQDWAGAIESLERAVTLTRAAGFEDDNGEALLALARLESGELQKPDDEVARLAGSRFAPPAVAATILLRLGDHPAARDLVLRAYWRARADGEPRVRHHELSVARELLQQLGMTEREARAVPVPQESRPTHSASRQRAVTRLERRFRIRN